MNETRIPTESNESTPSQSSNTSRSTSDLHQNRAPKKKRRSNLLLVTLALLVVASLGGAATLLVYKYYWPQNTQQSISNSTDDDSKKSTALDTITKLNGTYEAAPNNEAAVNIPIKVAGYKYYTGVDTSKAVGISGNVPYSDSAIVSAKIAKVLKENGFTERVVQNGNDEEMYIAHYTQRDVVCMTSITKTSNNPTGDHRVDVSCANMSDYISAASAQKPFYAAYPNKTPADDSIIQFVGLPDITKSKTSGFQTAEVSMASVSMSGEVLSGEFSGLFYQTPDKKWNYFTSTQNTPQCTEFDSEDLKKAYAETQCIDAAGMESMVNL